MKNSHLTIVTTRAYKCVLNEIFYCTVSILRLKSDAITCFVTSGWLPDDKLTKKVEYLKQAKISPHLPRLFYLGSEKPPTILSFDIHEGLKFIVENETTIT